MVSHAAGKLVLAGTAVPGAYDQRATPAAEDYPGSEVHANLSSGLLDGRLPVLLSWAVGFEIAQMLLVCAVLAASLLLTALLCCSITIRAFAAEGRQRRSLARLFGSYAPPELVAEMARDPARYAMRAENRLLAVMFCDMRNFTRVSEQMSPEDQRALMNRFFSEMTAVIREHCGTLDKYIGDAITAFWGTPVADPAHAANAVQAALAMRDAVNLASRIEALTRHYGVEVLAGQATRDEACDELRQRARAQAPGSQAAGIVWVEVDRVRVKGKNRDVTLFTPVPATLVCIPMFQDEMRLWQLALASHRRQHWDEAQARLQQLRPGCADSPLAGLYRQLDQRIAHHRIAPPPADWDGAHTFDSQ